MPRQENMFLRVLEDKYFSGNTDTYVYVPEIPLDVGNFNWGAIFARVNNRSATDIVAQTAMDRTLPDAQWGACATFALGTTNPETRIVLYSSVPPLLRWLRFKIGAVGGAWSGYVSIYVLLKRC